MTKHPIALRLDRQEAKIIYYCTQCSHYIRVFSISRALTLGALCLSSFVSLVWNTDFQTFDRDQPISCHTMGDKTRQEAGSWALSPALMVSDNSWWRYMFSICPIWLPIEVRDIFRFRGGRKRLPKFKFSAKFPIGLHVILQIQIKKFENDCYIMWKIILTENPSRCNLAPLLK